jgi:hypothetical protein
LSARGGAGSSLASLIGAAATGNDVDTPGLFEEALSFGVLRKAMNENEENGKLCGSCVV